MDDRARGQNYVTTTVAVLAALCERPMSAPTLGVAIGVDARTSRRLLKRLWLDGFVEPVDNAHRTRWRLSFLARQLGFRIVFAPTTMSAEEEPEHEPRDIVVARSGTVASKPSWPSRDSRSVHWKTAPGKRAFSHSLLEENESGVSLAQLGRVHGLSKSRIRQLIVQARWDRDRAS